MAERRWSFWMPPEDHRGWRWVRSQHLVWFTPLGSALLLTAGLGVVLSAPGTHLAAHLVLGAAAMALIAGLASGFFVRPQLEAQRVLPPPASAGQLLRYRVRLRNRGPRPLRALLVAEHALPLGLYAVEEGEGGCAQLQTLGPGEQATVSLALRCAERGAYQLTPLRVGTSFPSGLVRWPRAVTQAQRLLVFPRFTTQHEFELPVAARYQPGGIQVSSEVGDSGEFVGTRDYREGDRLRDIHWASFARSGRMIVKEYREEYFVRVGLVLDTELPRRGELASFESRVSLAAGIADALARREHIIDLFAAGERLYHFQSGRALARLDNVLELLACVESVPRVDFSVVTGQLALQARQLSSIVFLLWDWDEARSRACQRLRETGCGLRPIVVRAEPPSLEPEPGILLVPATAGAEELLR